MSFQFPEPSALIKIAIRAAEALRLAVVLLLLSMGSLWGDGSFASVRGTQAGSVDRGGLGELGTVRAKAVGLAVGSHSVLSAPFLPY